MSSNNNAPGQFLVNYKQIGPFHFLMEVITPDGVKFTSQGQADPRYLSKAAILNNFKDKSNWNNWICELEEILPVEKSMYETDAPYTVD